LTRRAKGVRALWGRCLSYGDGITYWPLREIVAQAPPGDERDALVTALESETPPSAAEIALLFRQYCGTLASERPLVLVFDDVHWAEPTLLELIEQLVQRGTGPLLVVCLAREELTEDRGDFLAGGSSERLVLDTLAPPDVDALLDGLGASVLESDQRARIAETAEGNPFFVEQLLALSVEGGLQEHALPPTVQALLAARLDRLGPGERGVLERAAVIGKEFSASDLTSLLEPEAAPTANAHLRTLTDRGFVRPDGKDGFSFRHVLLQDAVYRAAPKRLRAELHERFADRLEEVWAELLEVDEFAGYHLERAFRLRAELGESDRRTEQLAEDAGRRLGAAGFRALKRGDMPATVSLLDRAIPLLPPGDEARHELMCELGIAQYSAGDSNASTVTFVEAIALAEEAGQRRVELRARIDGTYLRLLTEPEGAASDLLAVAEAAVPVFEALDDARSLARAWLLIGYVRGGIHGNHAAWQEAEERALAYYRRTAFPPATCLGQIAAAVYWGPTPVSAGIERCAELLADETGYAGRAAVIPYLGGLLAQVGRFADARDLIAEAERIYEELGAATSVIHCGTVRADLELLAGDLDAAERTLREQCEALERIRDRAHLAVRAAKLAETLYRQERYEDAEEWAVVARDNAASDDRSVQLVLGPVEARLLAKGGRLSEARERAEEAVKLAETTDGLNQIAATWLALGDVLRMAGHFPDAEQAVQEALELYERKGNTVAADAARELIGVRAPA
jgi:tetratricopeptide (TPR) repeat protein